MGFVWSFFLFFISNAYEGVLVFYLCDKYLRGKLNERITLFHCFSPWVAASTIVSQKREHHGGVVVEFDHLLAAREQRATIEQDSTQDVFPSDLLPPTRPHPPMFLKHHRIMPENQAFNT